MNKEQLSPLDCYRQIVKENKSLRGAPFAAGVLASGVVFMTAEGRYTEASITAIATAGFYLWSVRLDRRRIAGAIIKSYSEGYCRGHKDGKGVVLEQVRRAQAEVVGDKEKKG